MLLSKLAIGSAKPPMNPEEVLPMGPCSTIDDGPPCLNLILYLECVTG
jgi:hypothetical protein